MSLINRIEAKAGIAAAGVMDLILASVIKIENKKSKLWGICRKNWLFYIPFMYIFRKRDAL